MDGSVASFRWDGSCRLVDEVEGTEVSWDSVGAWAAGWFLEWRSRSGGEASDSICCACGGAVEGVVDALVVLAETAGGDAELLSWVGAGPLEDLVSHSGNGLQTLDEVDRAARRSVAFRAALGSMWLASDVPPAVAGVCQKREQHRAGAWILESLEDLDRGQLAETAEGAEASCELRNDLHTSRDEFVVRVLASPGRVVQSRNQLVKAAGVHRVVSFIGRIGAHAVGNALCACAGSPRPGRFEPSRRG